MPEVTVDGATVDYDELGDPAGRPVLALHGTPAASSIYQPLDEAARAAGVRLVAPNRPGIRGSSRLAHHDVAAVARQTMAFADQLGLGPVGVLGWSGGGPYALACAAVAPEQVQAVVVAAGIEPPAPDSEPIARSDEKMMRHAHHARFLARAALAVEAMATRHSPEQALDAMVKDLPDVDRQAIEGHPGWASMAFFTESMASGTAGVVDDYWSLSSPWGIDLADVAVPVALFWGDEDNQVPRSHLEHLTAAVADGRLTVIPGAGHFFAADHADVLLAATAPGDG